MALEMQNMSIAGQAEKMRGENVVTPRRGHDIILGYIYSKDYLEYFQGGIYCKEVHRRVHLRACTRLSSPMHQPVKPICSLTYMYPKMIS